MVNFYYGTHIATNMDILDGLHMINKYGGNFIQFFLTKPLHKGVSQLSDEYIDEIKKYANKYDIKMVIHSSYMLNFANKPIFPNNDKNNKISWWIKNLLDELILASKLGAIGCVLHMGKKLENTKDVAYNNMYKSLKYVLKKKPSNVKLILETPSGQGTEMCYKLEDLSEFYNLFNKKLKKEIGFCIDTCHIFVSGYDIRKGINILRYLKLFNKLIGLDKITLFHLNDAKKDIGSKVDRHESLGNGYIGIEGLSYIIKYAYKTKIPLLLETPNETFISEIKYIKSLIKSL